MQVFAPQKSAAKQLYWVQHVFDPLTRAKAKGKLRILINDGLATHESLELMTYCFENNAIHHAPLNRNDKD